MKSYTELWDIVAGAVQDEGLRLFDLELGGGSGRRTVRVYISGPSKESPQVTVENCARVSKRLSPLLDVEADFLGDYLLEVSSPGVNRKLRRPEHFQEAVGERIRLKVRDSETAGGVVRGTLSAFDGQELTVNDDKDKVARQIQLAQVDNAFVDFPFDRRN